LEVLRDNQNRRFGAWSFLLNESDLKRLDRREGVLIGSYTRGPVEIYDQKGQIIRAQTYFAVRQREGDFAPYEDYIGLYIRGAKHFGLPAGYIESLEHIQNQAKTD